MDDTTDETYLEAYRQFFKRPREFERAWDDPFIWHRGPFHWQVIFTAIGGNLRPDIVYDYWSKRRAYAALERWEARRRT